MKNDAPKIAGGVTPGLDEGSGIAFTDVVTNIFAIVLLMLAILSLSQYGGDGPASARNRPEPEFRTIRDCYMTALRPVSQFVQVSEGGLTVLDYDHLAMGLAQGGGAVVTTDWGRLTITSTADGGDANSYRSDLLLFAPDTDAAAPLPVQAWTEAGVELLQARIYDRGHVPYFEVPARLLPHFSSLFHRLLADGRSFRWHLVDGNVRYRHRSADMFSRTEFCR